MEGLPGMRGGAVRIMAATVMAGTLIVQGHGTALAWSGFAMPQYFPIGHQAVAAAAVGVGGNAVAVAARGDNVVKTIRRGSDGSLQLVSSVPVGAAPTALLPIVPAGTTAADFLVVANHDDNTVGVLRGAGGIPTNLWSQVSVVGGPDALALADVNGDGTPDVVVAGGTSGTLSVLDSTGYGTFTNSGVAVSVGVDPVALASAVLASGAPLVAVADAGSDDVRLLSTSHGLLVPVATLTLGGPPSAVAFASVARNQLDLVVTTRAGIDASSGSLDIIPIDFSGQPVQSSARSMTVAPQPSGIVAADFNGDGYIDVAVSDDNAGTVSTWINDSGGGLIPDQTLQVGGGPAALIAAELSSDGLIDLATADATAGQVAVLAGQDPEVTLSSNHLDFGPISAMSSTTEALTITNSGVTPLLVYSINGAAAPYSITSDGCTGVSIAPGASCAVEVTFAPTMQGMFNGALILDDNAGPGESYIALHGIATAPP